MYLDNLVSAASTPDVQITYSEIMEDTLRMAETEATGEMLLMKAEAAKHILGNEGPAEWWTKIKVVARKLFEMLKNLLNKVFTFIKTIPQKVANVFRRIQLKWNKMGLESKYKDMIKKSGQYSKQRIVDDLADRTWFIAFDLGGSIANGVKALTTADISTSAGDILKAIDVYVKDIKKGGTQDAGDFAMTKAKADKLLEEAKNKVNDKLEDADENEEHLYAGCHTAADVMNQIGTLYNVIRNNYVEKAAANVAKIFERVARDEANASKIIYGEIEKAQRDDDDEKARAAINGLKGVRMCTAACASLSSKTVNILLRTGVNVASAVSAGFASIKGGSTSKNPKV